MAAKVIKPVKINILQTGNNSFKLVNYMTSDMTASSIRLFYDDKKGIRREIPLAFTDTSGTPVDSIAIPAWSVSNFMATLTQPAVNARDKGTFVLRFTGQIGGADRTIEQLITPHFLTHVSDASGQWDVYEYDLGGNRIANLTQGLLRGVPYYHAQPNPADSDVALFYADSGCSGNWSCLYEMTKSTGQFMNFQTSGAYWWKRDGSGTDNSLNYPLGGTCMFLPQDGSYSANGGMLAATGYTGTQRITGRSDIIFFADGQLALMVDMANFRVIPVDTNQCSSYNKLDQQYNETNPVFHPTLNKIAFDSDRLGTMDPALGYMAPYNLFVADAVNGGTVTQLTNAPAGVTGYDEPAWSPDGAKLLASGQVDASDYSRIFLLPATGGVPVPVTKDDGNHYYPQWLNYLGQ